MADTELKLDVPCPWCGTANGVGAVRCRQCFQALDGAEDARAAALFEMSRAIPACPHCGKTNLLSGERCFECGEPMGATRSEHTGMRTTIKQRRRSWFRGETWAPLTGWLKLAWLLRLGAALYLLGGVFDTTNWLMHETAGMGPQQDATATRYTIFAIFELARNAAVVAGVWLLTMLRPGRGA